MNNDNYLEILNNIQKNPTYKVINEQLYQERNNKLVKIVRDFEKDGLLYMNHDHELAGHFGIRATQEKLTQKYYWRGMLKDIEEYVKTCDKCQRRGKPNNKGELNPIEIKEPFYQIGIDFVGPLVSTKNRNRYIITAMDYFTKWPEARAVKRDTAEEVVKFLYEDIICRHGCPQIIISDRGTHFNNKVVELLTQKFQIKHNLSTSYHPQTNGLIERFNKTLCETLAKLVEDKTWDEKIPSILFAYRNKIQSSTKTSPAYLVYGRQLRYIDDISVTDRMIEVIEELPGKRMKAKQEIIKAQTKQKKYYDSQLKKEPQTFSIGEKVLKYNMVRGKSELGKFDDRWQGPYLIHEILMNKTYKIKKLDGKIFKTPVNGILLKKYNQRVNVCEDTNFEEGGICSVRIEGSTSD